MMIAAHPRAWIGAATTAATHMCPAPLPAETARMAAAGAGAEFIFNFFKGAMRWHRCSDLESTGSRP